MADDFLLPLPQFPCSGIHLWDRSVVSGLNSFLETKSIQSINQSTSVPYPWIIPPPNAIYCNKQAMRKLREHLIQNETAEIQIVHDEEKWHLKLHFTTLQKNTTQDYNVQRANFYSDEYSMTGNYELPEIGPQERAQAMEVYENSLPYGSTLATFYAILATASPHTPVQSMAMKGIVLHPNLHLALTRINRIAEANQYSTNCGYLTLDATRNLVYIPLDDPVTRSHPLVGIYIMDNELEETSLSVLMLDRNVCRLYELVYNFVFKKLNRCTVEEWVFLFKINDTVFEASVNGDRLIKATSFSMDFILTDGIEDHTIVLHERPFYFDKDFVLEKRTAISRSNTKLAIMQNASYSTEATQTEVDPRTGRFPVATSTHPSHTYIKSNASGSFSVQKKCSQGAEASSSRTTEKPIRTSLAAPASKSGSGFDSCVMKTPVTKFAQHSSPFPTPPRHPSSLPLPSPHPADATSFFAESYARRSFIPAPSAIQQPHSYSFISPHVSPIQPQYTYAPLSAYSLNMLPALSLPALQQHDDLHRQCNDLMQYVTMLTELLKHHINTRQLFQNTAHQPVNPYSRPHDVVDCLQLNSSSSSTHTENNNSQSVDSNFPVTSDNNISCRSVISNSINSQHTASMLSNMLIKEDHLPSETSTNSQSDANFIPAPKTNPCNIEQQTKPINADHQISEKSDSNSQQPRFRDADRKRSEIDEYSQHVISNPPNTQDSDINSQHTASMLSNMLIKEDHLPSETSTNSQSDANFIPAPKTNPCNIEQQTKPINADHQISEKSDSNSQQPRFRDADRKRSEIDEYSQHVISNSPNTQDSDINSQHTASMLSNMLIKEDHLPSETSTNSQSDANFIPAPKTNPCNIEQQTKPINADHQISEKSDSNSQQPRFRDADRKRSDVDDNDCVDADVDDDDKDDLSTFSSFHHSDDICIEDLSASFSPISTTSVGSSQSEPRLSIDRMSTASSTQNVASCKLHFEIPRIAVPVDIDSGESEDDAAIIAKYINVRHLRDINVSAMHMKPSQLSGSQNFTQRWQRPKVIARRTRRYSPSTDFDSSDDSARPVMRSFIAS